jgi:hypothetical protein
MRYRPLVLVVATFTVFAVTMAAAWGGDPPGNNGTVKVAGVALGAKGNEPHLGCTFDLAFFGFDAGPSHAVATFDLQAPSGAGRLHEDGAYIGWNAAGGANDDDGTLFVDLTVPIQDAGVVPTAQGYHVKLTVEAQGSIGSDVKHKTFWVRGCGGGEGEGEGGGEGGEGGGS